MSNPEQLAWLELPMFETGHGKAFRRFHKKNPWVYTELKHMLRILRHRGRKKVGMGMLFEVLRWNHYIAVVGPRSEEFKLNNNYRAYYTRLIQYEHPQLGEMLTSRASMADEEVFD